MFNRVVIRDKTVQTNNVHLAVHPFKHGAIIMLTSSKDFGSPSDEPLPEWKKNLATRLWDGIPGLHSLFFQNGEITLQHAGIFSDDEIVEAAIQIIQPVLEQNLLIMHSEES